MEGGRKEGSLESPSGMNDWAWVLSQPFARGTQSGRSIPCYLISTSLGPPVVEHILQQHPEYLVASFDLENQAQFWGSFIELVL